MFLKFGLFVVSLTMGVQSLSMPKYLKACSKSDPGFRKCAVKNGNYAIPYLIRGDKNFKIPNMNPLKIDFVQAIHGSNLDFNVTDVNLYGLDKFMLRDFDIDFENRKCKVDLKSQEILLDFSYVVDGNISVLPIKGQGPGTIKIKGGIFIYEFTYNLESRKNEKYAKIDDADKLNFTVTGMSYDLKNLFEGNKLLADGMHNFLNTNWIEMLKELTPTIETTVSVVCRTFLSNYLEKIPFREIFAL